MNDTIYTVFASDDNFSPYILVSINSLFYNNKDLSIHVFVLSNNISNKNKQNIMNLLNIYGGKSISFVDVDNLEDKLNLSEVQRKSLFGLTITAYARLFVCSLLPKDVEKVIYFDGDSLITDSIKSLWEIDLEDNWCAGVLDIVPFSYKRVINFKEEDDYINSGMLLINLKSWRENDLETKFLDYIKNNRDHFYCNDQGIVNVFMKDHLIIVDPKYNFQSPFHGKDYDTTLKWYGVTYPYYTKEIVENASNNPVFLHFSGGTIERPWSNEKNYYRKLYDFYVDMLDVNKEDIYKDTGSLSLMGKLYVVFSSNSLGYSLMKITPKSFTIWLKNYVVDKQFDNMNR